MDLYAFFSHLLSTENEQLLHMLTSCATVHTYEKGDLLISAGEKVEKVEFLLSGIYRGFGIKRDGYVKWKRSSRHAKALQRRPHRCLRTGIPAFLLKKIHSVSD